MRIAVRECRMDRKEFIKSFPGSESDSRWVSRVARKKDIGARIQSSQRRHSAMQRRIAEVEQGNGSVALPKSKKSIAE